MERECWRAVIDMNRDWTIANLGSLVQRIQDDNCLSCQYAAKAGQLIVLLKEAHTLRDAPSGTHEFARGWEAHKSAAWLANEIGHEIEWQAIKLYDDGRVVPQSAGSIHRGFVL
jgi:hypothetical protein